VATLRKSLTINVRQQTPSPNGSESSISSGSPDLELKQDHVKRKKVESTIHRNYKAVTQAAVTVATDLKKSASKGWVDKHFVIQDSGFKVNATSLGVETDEVKSCAGEFLTSYFNTHSQTIIENQKKKFKITKVPIPGCLYFATAVNKSTGQKVCFVTGPGVMQRDVVPSCLPELQAVAKAISSKEITYIVIPSVSNRFLNLIKTVTLVAHENKLPENHKHKRPCGEPIMIAELAKYKNELGENFEVTGLVACKDYPYRTSSDQKDYEQSAAQWAESPKRNMRGAIVTKDYYIPTKDLCEHCARKRFAYEATYFVESLEGTAPLSPRRTSAFFGMDQKISVNDSFLKASAKYDAERKKLESAEKLLSEQSPTDGSSTPSKSPSPKTPMSDSSGASELLFSPTTSEMDIPIEYQRSPAAVDLSLHLSFTKPQAKKLTSDSEDVKSVSEVKTTVLQLKQEDFESIVFAGATKFKGLKISTSNQGLILAELNTFFSRLKITAKLQDVMTHIIKNIVVNTRAGLWSDLSLKLDVSGLEKDLRAAYQLKMGEAQDSVAKYI
jgi:hypothetical protein